MKYLFIKGYPGVAIPLSALEACGGIKFIESKTVREGEEYKTYYWENLIRRQEGEIIDGSQILSEEPEEAK